MHQRRVILLVIAMLCMLSAPANASAAEESGSTAKWPWSGGWWPMLDQGNRYNLYGPGGPMQKYDQYLAATGRQTGAQRWERENRYSNNKADGWWGYCHAWAAAAILSPEPQAATRNGVEFSADDVKGLTTALYYEPTFTWLSGNRVDSADDTSSAAYKDIAPAWMDYLLRYYVRYHKYPFIMDVSANSEVWNFPVFAYYRQSTQLGGGVEEVRTRVWFAEANWNATGTTYRHRDYTYRLQAGTLGEWTGASVNEHPDFAWVPTGKRATSSTNPFVTERDVEAISGLDL